MLLIHVWPSLGQLHFLRIMFCNKYKQFIVIYNKFNLLIHFFCTQQKKKFSIRVCNCQVKIHTVYKISTYY